MKPLLSEEAAETFLSQGRVPKWMERSGGLLVTMFKNPESSEGKQPPIFLSYEVWGTMWDSEQMYASKYV